MCYKITQLKNIISMKTIFISYRRSDSADVVGRLFDSLKSRFGAKNVFKDLESIPAGVDFRDFISNAINDSEVLLAVIGRDWVTVADDSGARRIDDSSDFVRLEISEALKNGVLVIPVLLGGQRMPDAEDLPDDLKDLVYRNAVLLRPDPDYHNDVEYLSLQISERVPKLKPKKKSLAVRLSTAAFLAATFVFGGAYIQGFVKNENIVSESWHKLEPLRVAKSETIYTSDNIQKSHKVKRESLEVIGKLESTDDAKLRADFLLLKYQVLSELHLIYSGQYARDFKNNNKLSDREESEEHALLSIEKGQYAATLEMELPFNEKDSIRKDRIYFNLATAYAVLYYLDRHKYGADISKNFKKVSSPYKETHRAKDDIFLHNYYGGEL